MACSDKPLLHHTACLSTYCTGADTCDASVYDTRCRTSTGGACIRNIKAALPNLDRSGSASLYAVLAVGIALAVLGGIFMCITIVIIYRWRKVGLATVTTPALYTVLCCAVPCCAVLCCAVLCCAGLCCAVLCCAVLRCAVLRCAALLFSALWLCSSRHVTLWVQHAVQAVVSCSTCPLYGRPTLFCCFVNNKQEHKYVQSLQFGADFGSTPGPGPKVLYEEHVCACLPPGCYIEKAGG